MALHCSDLTPGSRDFNTAKKWTYLLFEEFFHQGDVERRENLPVSFLCDRNTTNVASNQPGFINFIVMPLFKSMSTILPGMQFLVDRASENSENWVNYTETDKDKQVYERSDLPKLEPIDSHEEEDFSGSSDEEKKSSGIRPNMTKVRS